MSSIRCEPCEAGGLMGGWQTPESKAIDCPRPLKLSVAGLYTSAAHIGEHWLHSRRVQQQLRVLGLALLKNRGRAPQPLILVDLSRSSNTERARTDVSRGR